MKFISKLIGNKGSDLIESIGNAIDKNITSKKEKGQLKNEFTNIVSNYIKENQAQVTNRHESDMSSDSWLSKNVRPLSLIFTTIAITLFAIFHKNLQSFEIDTQYIDLFKSLLILQYSFYFGLRGVEKITAIAGKYNFLKRKKNREE